MLSVKQGGIKYHFWVFGMTRPGIEPRSPGPLANTLTATILKSGTKKLIIIISRVISIHMGPMYTETPYTNSIVAQSAGAVELTDCTSAEG